MRKTKAPCLPSCALSIHSKGTLGGCPVRIPARLNQRLVTGIQTCLDPLSTYGEQVEIESLRTHTCLTFGEGFGNRQEEEELFEQFCLEDLDFFPCFGEGCRLVVGSFWT